jgi:hypothetical protein
MNMTVYIIDANRMFILETPGTGQDTGSVMSGDMRLQQQSANTATLLLNSSAVLYGQGYEYTSGTGVTGYYSSVGQVTDAETGANTGTLTINQSYDDDSGEYDANDPLVITSSSNPATVITLDSGNPGRATFSEDGSDSSFLYFYNANSAFFLSLGYDGVSQSNLATGWLEAQSGTLTDAGVAGAYLAGKLPTNSGSNDSIAQVTLASNGAVSGNEIQGNQGVFTWEDTLSGSTTYSFTIYDFSSAYGTFTILNPEASSQSCAVISSTKLVCMDNTSTGASMSILEK